MASPQQGKRFAATTLESERGIPSPVCPPSPWKCFMWQATRPLLFFMENSLLWSCICIYIDKGVLTPGTEDKLASYSAWKSMPMNNIKTYWFFSPKHTITAKIFGANKERAEAALSAHISNPGLTSHHHRVGESSSRAVAVPWAALACALNLQVQTEQDTIISCRMHSLTSHQTEGKDTGRFWSGSALLVPLNWLSARIRFGGNGKENWVRPF